MNWEERFGELSAYDAACGIRPLAGIDEAGRGPLAGPVVVAAVVLPNELATPFRIDDSKRLTARRRAGAAEYIREIAVAVNVVVVEREQIDRLNILKATLQGMHKAWSGLESKPALTLIDGNRVPPFITAARAVPQGDQHSLTIACASVIAKVTRDRIMVEMAEKYPEYGFAQHKGYGTAAHVQALRKHGPCDLHRRTFKPVAEARWRREVAELMDDMKICKTVRDLDEIRNVGQTMLDHGPRQHLPPTVLTQLNRMYRERRSYLETQV